MACAILLNTESHALKRTVRWLRVKPIKVKSFEKAVHLEPAIPNKELREVCISK